MNSHQPHHVTAATDGEGFTLDAFHPILQRALRLESNPQDLLSYATTDRIPYWALIRLPLMIRLYDRMRGENSARDIYLKPRPIRIRKSLGYLASSLWRSPFRYVEKDIVFLCSGVNRVNEQGRYFNSRVDYFAGRLATHRLLLIEGANDLRYAWPRAIEPVSFRGGLTGPVAVRARLGRLQPREKQRIRDFMSLLQNAFHGILDEMDCALLGQLLQQSILRSKAYYAACARLLDRLKPRLVFVENAHSGIDVEFVLAARERKATTAEYQHGAINPACPYHNFHPRILAGPYAACLPDCFLSYGDFWNGLLSTSARVITIGNPHVAGMLARAPAVSAKPGSVYFLSSANDPGLYMERIRELVAEGFSVVFRPHPVERPLLADRYGTFFADLKIAVDVGNDFYGQLRLHEFVIGDGRSTSLFEAYALTGGRVFIMEMTEQLGEQVPNHAFLRTIRSASELRSAGLVERGHRVQLEALFATDWERRLDRFVAGVLES